MNASGAVGGWFEPGDEIGRAWDEAEAILLACDDLDAVMEVIRDAESPVEARRALKLGFGFTGRQAAVLLTLPVMTFTRSERRRIDENRRDRLEMLADVTGVLPAIPADEPVPAADAAAEFSWGSGPALEPLPLDSFPQFRAVESATAPALGSVAPLRDEPSPAATIEGPSVRRSTSRADESHVVLDEQIGELCEAIAEFLGIRPSGDPGADDPRDPAKPAGSLLDSCGVDDATGLRTLLWHLSRTGLDSVEGLFPFADPLSAAQAFDAQAVRFEHAMATGSLGSEPGGGVRWASRMWPVAERHGFGYAVSYRSGPGAGVVWAYGGNEPLHRMWDSVVHLLVELYQALIAGEPCDSALASVVGDRVVWTNLS
ncbi:DNA gyrase subunit A [Dietzia alimentaria]|uniref:DNA gyrase subunit A n=1 Tax=Dietzia alimentaria TaxID=665550 RepID=UPI00029B3202|nr:DNA gyrase subunit A [Dietzia alimentaria]